MSVYKRNLFSKNQNDSSIKDNSFHYSIRHFTKQLLQRQQPLTTRHPPKSTKTSLIPPHHSLTSSKSTRTKRFINNYQHKPSAEARSSFNINKQQQLTKSNESSMIIDNNDKQLQSDINKTMDDNNVHANTNRTKRISISSTCSHRAQKMSMKCKSKKDILDYLNELNSPIYKQAKVNVKRGTLKKHNSYCHNKISNHNIMKRRSDNDDIQTVKVDTRNVSNKLLFCVVNISKGKVIKKNLSSNDIYSLIHYKESQEKEHDQYCKILRHRIAVLKFQIDKKRTEKTKLDDIITKTLSQKERIGNLQNEIRNYKRVISIYQKNCNELTKEIYTLQTKIKAYK